MTCCDQVYFCPTSGEEECAVHGGFDTCCGRPDLHREAFVAAPPEIYRPIVAEQMKKWRTTLDWLAER